MRMLAVLKAPESESEPTRAAGLGAQLKHRLFYQCSDSNRPSGGQKSSYQHVDVLNRYGYAAYAVHTDPKYRLTWFQNETQTICWRDVWKIFDPNTDVLVFPETFGRRIREYPGKKVIFSKSIYYGFNALGPRFTISDPYRDCDLLGVLVVSHHSQTHLQFAYPDLPIFKVVEHIDSSRFPFVPFIDKKRQIVYVNKSPSMLQALICAFFARTERGLNTGGSAQWIPLENRTEGEVGSVLGQSMIFLFPSTEEGLGRLPLEALLCGCAVLTWDVGPLDEYVPSLLRTRMGDISGFTSKLENILSGTMHIELLQQEIAAGRRNALAFSADAHRDSVCLAWEQLLLKC